MSAIAADAQGEDWLVVEIRQALDRAKSRRAPLPAVAPPAQDRAAALPAPSKAPTEAGMPPLPPGFVLEQAAAMPPLPTGFVLENAPAAASHIGGGGNPAPSASPVLPAVPAAPAVHGPNGAPATNADQNPWQRFVEYPFMRGVNTTGRIADTAQILAGLIDEDEYWRRIDAHDKAREAWPLHPDEQAGLDSVMTAPGMGEAAWQLLTHPNVIPGLIVENVVPSVGSIALGTAAGAAGGSIAGPPGNLVGGAVGAALSSFSTEYLLAVNQQLEEARDQIRATGEQSSTHPGALGDMFQHGLPAPDAAGTRALIDNPRFSDLTLDQIVQTMWPGGLSGEQMVAARSIVAEQLAKDGIAIPADTVRLDGARPEFNNAIGGWTAGGTPIREGQTAFTDGAGFEFRDGKWVPLVEGAILRDQTTWEWQVYSDGQLQPASGEVLELLKAHGERLMPELARGAGQ